MGIYVHIPFCRQKCFYCGFYSVASPDLKESYTEALCREIELRKTYLKAREIPTLYFGGGTPSFLSSSLLEKIVRKIETTWQLAEDAERTIEMNPEDAQREKLQAFRQLGFNRLSIGVQSFNDTLLQRINRRHSGKDARMAVERAAAAGFDNIGIDLIIGLPGSSPKEIKDDLEIVKYLPITHISVYILSIDSNTVLERLLEKGQYQPEDDDVLAENYLNVADYLKNIGFEHYEISNFAKKSKYSIHNTAYWQQKEYIGLGASAHSFNGDSRQWNIARIDEYIKSLNNNCLNFEKELLTKRDKYNEYLMTTLRTVWGCEVDRLKELSPAGWEKSMKIFQEYIRDGYAIFRNGKIRLTVKGWLISDRIFSSLFE